MSEPRPKLTSELILAAARVLAADLAKDGQIEEDAIEQSAQDIAKYGRSYMDGYALAKKLDDRAYWDCNLSVAETLDSFGSYTSAELRKAEEQWVERCGIQPLLPVGSRVAFGRTETGTIEGVYQYGPAKYLVKVDGEEQRPGNPRRIVNFEDVTELARAEA